MRPWHANGWWTALQQHWQVSNGPGDWRPERWLRLKGALQVRCLGFVLVGWWWLVDLCCEYAVKVRWAHCSISVSKCIHKSAACGAGSLLGAIRTLRALRSALAPALPSWALP